MSSTLLVIAGVAYVAWTIFQQVRGTPIRARRLVVLPAIVTVIGVVDLSGNASHPSGTDVLLIVVGALVAAAVGLGLGAMTRLESRDGGLWGQLPLTGLWLWAAFFVSRGVLIGIAHGAGAHVAGGTDAELLVLGVNRVGQALVIGGRAMRSGIPFTAEGDGSRPLSGMIGGGAGSPTDGAPPASGSSSPFGGGGLLGGGLLGRGDRRAARRSRRRR